MRIKSLGLEGFRNFSHMDELDFPESSLLVAMAPNATGKTNFLEAVSMLLRGKSFRAQYTDCVQWGREGFMVKGSVLRGEDTTALAVQYHSITKTLRVEEDGVVVSPVTFYQQYPYVLFLPEDTFLFNRGPALRRNFLNTTLVSAPHYLSAVVQYQRALKQRNAALKKAVSGEDVQVWNQLLVQYAGIVWGQRQAFTSFLETHLKALHEDLFNEVWDAEVIFSPGTARVDKYLSDLEGAFEYERRYQYTLHGPHRDDFNITIDGRPAAAALSRGQLRSLVITLKVAAWKYMKQVTQESPILLFDEVLSELDEDRQRRLFKHLPGAQTLLTCTAIPEGVRAQEGVQVLDLQAIIKGEVQVTTPDAVEYV